MVKRYPDQRFVSFFKGKRLPLLVCACLLHFTGFSQLFYNNGADVAVMPGGLVYIGGSTENAYGYFGNGGSTTILGYFKNESNANGFDTTGTYNVYGDWINDRNFQADHSTVNLTGGQQRITGSVVTTFYDLNLLTDGSVKEQTLDANVSDALNLNNSELATGNNKMHVLNPVFSSVARENGFVSSTGPGRLVRNTNSTVQYLFPTGWNDSGDIYYRPVEITPSINEAQSFAVRMAFDSATKEGYDLGKHDSTIELVNPKFFHLIKQYASNAPAKLSIFYDQTRDGQWASIGRWQTLPEWQDLTNTTLTDGSPLSYRTKADWTDNGYEPHALVNFLINDTIPFNFPNVFVPGSQDPGVNNATFHFINEFDKAELLQMKIFDRWGEIVYDSERDGTTCVTPSSGTQPTFCWDGKYKGKLQPMGNYVYVASVKIIKTGEVKNVSGDLALLW